MISVTKRNTTEKETRLNMAFISNVNLSIDIMTSFLNSITRLEIQNARQANIFAETWQNPTKTYRISIISFVEPQSTLLKNHRQLGIAIISPAYVMQIELDQAEVRTLKKLNKKFTSKESLIVYF